MFQFLCRFTLDPWIYFPISFCYSSFWMAIMHKRVFTLINSKQTECLYVMFSMTSEGCHVLVLTFGLKWCSQTLDIFCLILHTIPVNSWD